MGIKTFDEQEKVVTYLSVKFGPPADKIENGICECLQERYSDRRFYDTVREMQDIYTMVNSKLQAYNLEGTEVSANKPKWRIQHMQESFKGIMWWNSDHETEYKSNLCENMILTTN